MYREHDDLFVSSDYFSPTQYTYSAEDIFENVYYTEYNSPEKHTLVWMWTVIPFFVTGYDMRLSLIKTEIAVVNFYPWEPQGELGE